MPSEDAPRSEVDLVRRAQSGDEDAVRELFEKHVADLRARVRRRLPALARGKLAASDVVQEAYLTAFLRLADFEDRGEGSFGRWLSKILEHKIRHEVKRYLGTAKRAAYLEVNHRPSRESGTASRQRTPGSEMAATEDRQRLARAMRLLSDADREILTFVHEDGLRFTEAGERLGVTADAARMRHGRALTRLSELLREGPP